MDLLMSSLGTFVSEGPCCVFYIGPQVYWGLTHNVFFARTNLILHTQTKTQVHAGRNRHAHSSHLYYTE